ncbi:MAG: PG0541 family transporter-associated protein [Planctomycetota bacterium]
MKLLHLSFHFEYADIIERILDQHEVSEYARYSMVEGKDRDGKHFGTQVFPGNITAIQAQVPEDKIDTLFDDLQAFREEKDAHRHLQALILPVERQL